MGLITDWINRNRQNADYQALFNNMLVGTPQDAVNITPRVTAPPTADLSQLSGLPPQTAATALGPSLPLPNAPWTPPANVQPMGQDNPSLAARAPLYGGPAPPTSPQADQLRNLLSGVSAATGYPILSATAAQEAGAKGPIKLGKDESLVALGPKGTYDTLARGTGAPTYAESPHPGINPTSGKLDQFIIANDGTQRWLNTPPPPNIEFVNGQPVDKSTGLPVANTAPIPQQQAQVKPPDVEAQDIRIAGAEAKARTANEAPSVERDVVLPLLQKVRRGETLTPGEQSALATAKPGAVVGGDDPSVQTVAKAIANYQQPPLQGFVMKSPWGQAVTAQVYSENPDYRAQNYNQSNATQTAFAKGPQSNQVRFLNVAVPHLATLDKLAQALNNGDVQAINRLQATFKEQFGSTAPTNFDAAKAIVGDEVVKAIIGSGGALADRENAQNQISRAKTPAQLAQITNTYRELMGAQLRGLKQQYEQGTFLKNFDEKLSDETKTAIGGTGPVTGSSTIPGTPDAQGWITMPNGVRIREKK